MKKDNRLTLILSFQMWFIVLLGFFFFRYFQNSNAPLFLIVLYSIIYWLVQAVNVFLREKKKNSYYFSIFLVQFSALFLFFILTNNRWFFLPLAFSILGFYTSLPLNRYYQVTGISILAGVLVAVFDHFFFRFGDLSMDLFVCFMNLVVIFFFRHSNKIYHFQKDRAEEANRLLLKEKELVENQNKIIQEKNSQLLQELELAKQIQKNIIPQKPPLIEGLSIDFRYKPMDKLGGDFFDFIHMKEQNLLGFFISDVSGHGVPAALVTCMIKALLETAGPNRLSPQFFLQYLNERLVGKTNDNFLTAFYTLYDKEKRTLQFARGGHNLPFLVREGRLIELYAEGGLLGIYEDRLFQEHEIRLYPKDKILFYTDGLTEATDAENREFSSVMPKILLEYASLPIKDYISIIYNKVTEFKGVNHFEDDVCIVGFEVL